VKVCYACWQNQSEVGYRENILTYMIVCMCV
jgi:hypothetical protein